jgi:hypothetical protein
MKLLDVCKEAIDPVKPNGNQIAVAEGDPAQLQRQAHSRQTCGPARSMTDLTQVDRRSATTCAVAPAADSRVPSFGSS